MKVKGKIIDLALDYSTHRPKLTIQLNRQDNLYGYDEIKDEELLDIEIKKATKKRGLKANKYFHALINDLACYYRSKGIVISDDEVKININLQYGTLARDNKGKVMGVKVPKDTDIQEFYPYAKWYKTEDDCDCYIFYKRTHNLDSKEFWQLIKGLEWECEKVGIETLEEKEFKKMMEEYERDYKKNRSI